MFEGRHTLIICDLYIDSLQSMKTLVSREKLFEIQKWVFVSCHFANYSFSYYSEVLEEQVTVEMASDPQTAAHLNKQAVKNVCCFLRSEHILLMYQSVSCN